MLCYQNKTFCSFYETCQSGHKCLRALTIGIVVGSEYTGLPISEYYEKPDCYVVKDKNTSIEKAA